MPQEPFTTAGVEQKLDDLYALSDTLLAIEADAVKTDFRQWVKDNFILSTVQSTYLDNMSEQWVRIAACDSSTAILFRLPVTLEFEGTPGGLSKLVRNRSSFIAEDGPTGTSTTGTVEFTIVYS